ncbi:D-alanyl-D-alanine carboxypeptidase PBP3 [Streptococcus parauberis]|uniref:D-alanyl-D-alanine carboxypeptidase PBP3 n=1 Tax=Streptococcus parauberis TaxID=1348 RepID=UPI000789BB5B|nr:D-alanyl-D-alanine carboxypeptidase PBP3 [Streptococcus parauberis]KYP20739.1 D-alanyl-D-alanine carboxypeptidase DacA precursor [Streptococcus parauberis]KYP22534.1 D-alanyl-D-alanine carboxypeptidase DacA precursor [Streptococcus parauberis]KYP22629.1 D-alanyl-D-alanine carboxypeptidase DacA precursor [Streptococcus parauberis]KYP27155.1 D-alanyl-D-alanine carboxypeptidase DacA precursor [Streptococcus parauberis]KYP28913.1 D-alanyl-D-alanine carboxypeptidase DacA precursor [Streptococcus
MKKIIMILSLLVSTITITTTSAEDIELKTDSAIAFDIESGKVLYEKNAKKILPVASATKVLTTYMVYKEIEQGKLEWSSPVTISDYPFQLTTNYTISNVPLDARKYTVKQLMKAMLVTNANSAAIALAEKIGGTEPIFVDKMKKQLKVWGINDAKLYNATGLPNSILGDNIYPKSKQSAENKLSAKDLAIITHHLLTEYPEVLKYTSLPKATFDGQDIYSYNYMLEGYPYERVGINGLFLGSPEKSGPTFIASSKINKMKVISIVIGAHQEDNDVTEPFKTTSLLLDYLYQNFERVTLLKKNQVIKDKSFAIKDSPDQSVSISPKEDMTIIKKIGTTHQNEIIYNKNENPFYAPLANGDTLATAKYKDPNIIGMGYIGKSPVVTIQANQEVKRSFFLKVWWNHFVDYVNTNL